jgi:hypothetical protein
MCDEAVQVLNGQGGIAEESSDDVDATIDSTTTTASVHVGDSYLGGKIDAELQKTNKDFTELRGGEAGGPERELVSRRGVSLHSGTHLRRIPARHHAFAHPPTTSTRKST